MAGRQDTNVCRGQNQAANGNLPSLHLASYSRTWHCVSVDSSICFHFCQPNARIVSAGITHTGPRRCCQHAPPSHSLSISLKRVPVQLLCTFRLANSSRPATREQISMAAPSIITLTKLASLHLYVTAIMQCQPVRHHDSPSVLSPTISQPCLRTKAPSGLQAQLHLPGVKWMKNQ